MKKFNVIRKIYFFQFVQDLLQDENEFFLVTNFFPIWVRMSTSFFWICLWICAKQIFAKNSNTASCKFREYVLPNLFGLYLLNTIHFYTFLQVLYFVALLPKMYCIVNPCDQIDLHVNLCVKIVNFEFVFMLVNLQFDKSDYVTETPTCILLVVPNFQLTDCGQRFSFNLFYLGLTTCHVYKNCETAFHWPIESVNFWHKFAQGLIPFVL